jgi:hypothetical protein
MAMLTPATTVNPPNHSNRGIGCLPIGARQTHGRPRELSQLSDGNLRPPSDSPPEYLNALARAEGVLIA